MGGRIENSLTPAPTPRMMRRILAMIGGTQAGRKVPDARFDALGAAMALAGPTTASMGPEMFRWNTPHPHLAVTDHELAHELASCPMPIQLIWGDRDKVQSPDAGIRAAALLPNASLASRSSLV